MQEIFLSPLRNLKLLGFFWELDYIFTSNVNITTPPILLGEHCFASLLTGSLVSHTGTGQLARGQSGGDNRKPQAEANWPNWPNTFDWSD